MQLFISIVFCPVYMCTWARIILKIFFPMGSHVYVFVEKQVFLKAKNRLVDFFFQRTLPFQIF